MSELTIGILLTDHVLEDLQVKHGDQNDFYNKIFTEADPNIKLKIYVYFLGQILISQFLLG